MSERLKHRSFVLFSAFAVMAATVAVILSAPASAGTGAIRYVGHPRTASTTAAAPSTPTATGPASDRAELSILRERMEEDAEFSPAGKSIAITKNLPSASDVTMSATGLGFAGLTHFDSRYADGGNQFSGEPADLGMCTNGTYLLELVNNAVQLFRSDGTPVYDGEYGTAGSVTEDDLDGTVLDPSWTVRDALSLNAFFGMEVAFDRDAFVPNALVQPAGTFGPNLFDVSCIYDSTDNMWIATSAKIDVEDTTGEYTERGSNSVLLAVNVGDVTDLDDWDIYEIDTTNDGRYGTPDHACDLGPCFGDYPQLGVNEDGIFITTNEFSFNGSGFYGAQLYAIDKGDLMGGLNPNPDYVHIENVFSETVADVSYTLQPANTSEVQNGHVMYFGMSASPFSATVTNEFAIFALDTTELGMANPRTLVTREDLTETTITSPVKYGTPQWALQKVPSMSAQTPFLNYLNAGAFGVRYAKQKSPIPLDAGSGKFYGAWMDDGFLFFSTATAAKGTGAAVYSSRNGGWSSIKQRAGLALFVVDVDDVGSLTPEGTTDAKVYGVSNANLIYPSVAVHAGKGGSGVTLVGPGYWPSAAVLTFDVSAGGAISAPQIQWSAGTGPNDGFTGTGDGGYRTRWGDYGAAAVDAQGDLWFAVHDIRSSCTNSEFGYTGADPDNPTYPFGVCGGERSTYANWSTRIFEVDL